MPQFSKYRNFYPHPLTIEQILKHRPQVPYLFVVDNDEMTPAIRRHSCLRIEPLPKGTTTAHREGNYLVRTKDFCGIRRVHYSFPGGLSISKGNGETMEREDIDESADFELLGIMTKGFVALEDCPPIDWSQFPRVTIKNPEAL